MGKGQLWPFAQAHHPEALKGCRYGESSTAFLPFGSRHFLNSSPTESQGQGGNRPLAGMGRGVEREGRLDTSPATSLRDILIHERSYEAFFVIGKVEVLEIVKIHIPIPTCDCKIPFFIMGYIPTRRKTPTT